MSETQTYRSLLVTQLQTPSDNTSGKPFSWGSAKSPPRPLPGQFHGLAVPRMARYHSCQPALGDGKSQGKWKCEPSGSAPLSCVLGRAMEDTGTPTSM